MSAEPFLIFGKKADCPDVRPQFLQARAANSPRKHKIADLMVSQQFDAFAGVTQPTPGVRAIFHQRRIGEAFNGKQEIFPAAFRTGICQQRGEESASGDNAKLRFRHAPFAADISRGWNHHG